MDEDKKTYPIGEEKFNCPKTILRMGEKRAATIKDMVFPEFSKTTEEKVIQGYILLALAHYFTDDVDAWRNNTGAMEIGGRFVRFGKVGQADISGVMSPYGTRLEIEVKKPGKKPSDKQKIFGKIITKRGGLYLVCDGDIHGQVLNPIKQYLERMSKVIR